MTTSLRIAFRERFHPLHHARRVPPVRAMLRLLDQPLWARVKPIHHPVRVRLVRHGSYIVGANPEPAITALVAAAVDVLEPSTFVDVGANFGYYGLLVASRCPAARVVLVEPDEDNVALVRSTLSRTAAAQVRLEPVAVGATSGEAAFVRDRTSGARGSIVADHASAARVPLRTLDELTSASGCVDMIKIDVEGHEAEVLSGAAGVLERDTPLLVFESFGGVEPLRPFLDPLGYRYWDADHDRPPDRETTNYLAWAPRHEPSFAALRGRWRELRG